jgi:hypothetical protein
MTIEGNYSMTLDTLRGEHACGQHRRLIGVLVVWRANQDDGDLFLQTFGEVEVGRELDAVAHRDEHASLKPHRVLRLRPVVPPLLAWALG